MLHLWDRSWTGSEEGDWALQRRTHTLCLNHFKLHLLSATQIRVLGKNSFRATVQRAPDAEDLNRSVRGQRERIVHDCPQLWRLVQFAEVCTCGAANFLFLLRRCWTADCTRPPSTTTRYELPCGLLFTVIPEILVGLIPISDVHFAHKDKVNWIKN